MNTMLSDPKSKVADLTGLTTAEIGTTRLQVDILKREGFLVNLDISGSSLFICGVDWGELGINDDSTRAQRMSAGRKWLYPKAQVNLLNTVISAMRQSLNRLTYDLTGFRPARYMHYKVYSAWKQEWAGLIERFNTIKAELIATHEDAVDFLAEDFGKIAQEAWDAARGNSAEFVVFDKQAYNDFDLFRDAVIRKALEKMPTTEKIEQELHADYKVTMLYGLDDIAKEEEAARLAKEAAEVELNRIKSLEHEAYLKDAAAQEDYNHKQRMIRLEEEEKEIQIQAMMEAEAAHAREQLKQVVSPFQEVFISLRNQIAEDVQGMLDSIKKNGYCRGKIAEKGVGLIDLYNLMSVTDDHELHGKLIALKNAIGQVGEERPKDAPERDTAQVVEALESIKELAHKAAQDLASGPSRFAMAE